MRPGSLASLWVASLWCIRPSGAKLLSHTSTPSSSPSSTRPLAPPAAALPPPLDILYRTSVVPIRDFALIQQHASSLLLMSGGSRGQPRLRDEASSVAVGRQGMTLERAAGGLTTNAATTAASSSSSSLSFQLVQILDRHVTKMLLQQTGREYRLCDDVPAELRVYQKLGAAMAWHQDDVLYDPPQVEVVFTIENTSNCATRWKRGPGPGNDDDESSVETDPNSALVLAAGGPWHCVTSLKRGRRVIVKLAYVLPGAQRVDPSSSPKDCARRRRK